MDPPTPTTTMSSSTQNRILIWRTEVASACDPSSSTASDHGGTSAASLTNSSSYATTASTSSPPLVQTLSRGRRFLRRLSRRLSGHGRDSTLRPGQPLAGERTEMYRTLALNPATADDNAEISLSDNSGQGDAARGLREKKERLMRAARLLNQGVGEFGGVKVAM